MLSTTVSPMMFRNVYQTPATPIEDWCQQVVDNIIQYGESGDYLVLLKAIWEMPDSAVVEKIRYGLTYADPEWCVNIDVLQSAFDDGPPSISDISLENPNFPKPPNGQSRWIELPQ